MKLRHVSILALAISCCALALPPQDDGAPRERSDRASRGARGSMPLPPDWPRAGGFGPGSQGGDRPMIEGLLIDGLIPAAFGRRELTDEDLARVLAVAREISPEWGETLEARIKQEPAQVKAMLRTGGRRLLGLTALRERAPEVYAVKVKELRAQAATDRAAEELQKAESAGADETSLAARRAALEAAAASQVDATLAARAAELDALEGRLKRLRDDIAADGARRPELAAEVAKRAQRRTDAASDAPLRRE